MPIGDLESALACFGYRFKRPLKDCIRSWRVGIQGVVDIMAFLLECDPGWLATHSGPSPYFTDP
jgi:hypothetical protein